jgi:hypothetical protein
MNRSRARLHLFVAFFGIGVILSWSPTTPAQNCNSNLDCPLDPSSGSKKACCCTAPWDFQIPGTHAQCQFIAICDYPIIFGSCCCPDYYLGCPSGFCDAWTQLVDVYNNPADPYGRFAAPGDCVPPPPGSSGVCAPAITCTTPDPADPYQDHGVNLYTGCVDLTVPTPLPLVFRDDLAPLNGPNPMTFPPDGPYSYVAGKGWMVGLDESVEERGPASATYYVLHTPSGDIYYRTQVTSLGGYIASPSDGTVLIPPAAGSNTFVIVGANKSKRFYGQAPDLDMTGQVSGVYYFGSTGVPYVAGLRAALWKEESYGGPDNPMTPVLAQWTVIKRNKYAQITQVDVLRNPRAGSPAGTPPVSIKSISLTYKTAGGGDELVSMTLTSFGQMYGTWSITANGDHRIATITMPSSDATKTLDVSFTYDAVTGLLTSETDPVVNGQLITRYTRDPGSGQVTALDVGTPDMTGKLMEPASITSRGISYFTCGAGNTDKGVEVLLPHGLIEKYRFDTGERRVRKFANGLGRQQAFVWRNGVLVEGFDPQNEKSGDAYGYDAVNGQLNLLTSRADGKVTYKVNSFQGQTVSTDPPQAFLPTSEFDAGSGLTRTAQYDSLNRVTRFGTSIKSLRVVQRVERVAHDASVPVPGGTIDVTTYFRENGSFQDIPQGAVTIDDHGDVLATFKNTVKVADQLLAITRDDYGRVTQMTHVPTKTTVVYSMFNAMGLPQKMEAGKAPPTTFMWSNWGQMIAWSDTKTTVTTQYAPTGEHLKTETTTGGRTARDETEYDTNSQAKAIKHTGDTSKNGGKGFVVKSYDVKPETGRRMTGTGKCL